MNIKEAKTGELFSSLWTKYDRVQYERTIELFRKRFEANNFDLKWFKGKICLDVGCGSGRYSVAMAKLGAAKVTGIDIGEEGIEFAQKMASGNKNIEFRVASALEIPFPDLSFDFVCCSGVIMHTKSPQKAVSEIYRVMKKNGLAYFLVYGAGGLSWGLTLKLRKIIHTLGIEKTSDLLTLKNLDVNKKKNFLDNYFVPYIDFFTWSDLSILFQEAGFKKLKRWSKGQFDHESSFDSYLKDLKLQQDIFEVDDNVIKAFSAADRKLLEKCSSYCQDAVNRCSVIMEDHRKGYISKKIAELEIYGFGHHRLLAYK